MADLGRAPAGRPMSLVWMILALVVVGGFLTWLGIASEQTAVVVVEGNDENDEAGGPDGAPLVEREALVEGLAAYGGQRIRVAEVPATGRLGPTIFWGELGDMGRQRPVLIRMDPGAAGAVEIEAGRAYTITGAVHPVTEELVETWGEAGEFAGEGEQMQATFADYYIQATMVRPTPAPRGQQGS